MAVDPRKCVLVCVLLSSVFLTCLSSEQGKWSKTLRVNSTVSYLAVYKTLYNNSGIHLSITCGEESEGIVEVNWMLRWSPCAEEYLEVTSKQEYNLVTRPTEDFYFIKPDMSRVVGMVYPEVEYVKAIPQIINCTDKAPQYLTLTKEFTTSKMSSVDENGKIITTPKPEKGKEKVVAETLTEGEAKNKTKPKTNTASRKRRAEAAEGDNQKKDNQKKAPALQHHPDKPTHHDLLSEAWRDGVYLFILQVKTPGGQTDEQDITADISMEYKDAYLSAMEWPLLIFFGVMCVVYVILGLVWLFMLACNWRDLLRVQFWIGGVIVLGMLEKAVFYAEYQNINSKGESVPGAVICAELVSCLKRTVARMLVIIVSLGFGIVKPRLGPMLHKVLGVGTLYFIFAAVEGCYRTVKAKSDQSRKLILVAVPLALIDAIICWWIFSSLVQTLRTLRLRRNIVKLSLYRHFTNTLVFAVLASIAFMVWSYTQHRLKMCLTDWKELWVDDAYWHLLFSVILVVIMVLWRPTINNQRYAFSPLLDAADDEADEDVIMSDAWDGMKMRGVRNGSPRQSAASKAEDDLKWVEENIPSSIIDKALPVIDSDEEIVTTKLEMAKME